MVHDSPCCPNIASTRLVKFEPAGAEAAVEAAHPAAQRVTAAVVDVAFFGSASHLVRLGDLLEPLRGAVFGGDVGVQLPASRARPS